MTPEQEKLHDERLLEEATWIDKAFAEAETMYDERFTHYLLALVQAARLVVGGWDNHTAEGREHSVHCLSTALDQFEPWLEQEDENDPRAMGWVDGKGRP